MNTDHIQLMKQACLLCDNSSCEIKTGCLILSDGIILSSGWNSETKHAEKTALESIKDLIDLDTDLVIYTTRFPCLDCSILLSKLNLTKLFYMSDHFTSNNAGLNLFQQRQIPVVQILESEIWK